MNKTLQLNLKKKWFDLILSREKKEEYREIKPYWIKRLTAYNNAFDECRDFSTVTFKNGYSNTARIMIVECLKIEIGNTKPEWAGEETKKAFVISLGKILETKNI